MFIIIISFLIQHRRHVALNSLHAKIRLRAYLRAGAVTGKRIVRMAQMNHPIYVCMPFLPNNVLLVLFHPFSLHGRSRVPNRRHCTTALPQLLFLPEYQESTAPLRGGGCHSGQESKPSICPSSLYLPSCCSRGLWLWGCDPS